MCHQLVDRDKVRRERWSRVVPPSGNVLCRQHEIVMKKDDINCFVAIFTTFRKYSSTPV